MQGITGTTYLTRSLLNKIFNKNLSTDDIDNLILSGKLAKHFSYYKPTEMLLRELEIIPDTVKIDLNYYNMIAKRNAFTLKELQPVFSNCNRDTLKIIAAKVFCEAP